MENSKKLEKNFSYALRYSARTFGGNLFTNLENFIKRFKETFGRISKLFCESSIKIFGKKVQVLLGKCKQDYRKILGIFYKRF